MNYQVVARQVESVLTAVIRDRVPARELSRFVPAACGEVWSFVRAEGLPRPGRHIALYLENGTVEVGAEISAPFTGNDRVHLSSLPAGHVATTTHLGPYGGLSAAHAATRLWCAEHGHKVSLVCWEIYGNWEDSWNSNPSLITTEVFYQLLD